jgi:putative membrane protein
MFQVEAGKLAVQRAGSEEVKKFGQQMIDDHSKADRELTQLAQTKGITLPQNLTREERVDLDMLSKKTGKEFDQAYMSLMVRDHSKDIGEFRKEAQSGKDPDVKAWASKTLTTVESHHSMATDISHRH